MCRFVAADLDGTLIKDDGSIDHKSLELISKLLMEKKIEKFVIASGRHFRELWEVLDSIKCPERVIVICCDGQYIYDAKGNHICSFDAYVAPQHIKELCEHSSVASVQIITDEKDYTYFRSPVRHLLHRIKDFVTGNRRNNYIGNDQIKTISKVEKLIVFCKSEDYDLNVDKDIYSMHHLRSGALEVLAVNKLLALECLENMGYINLDETIYFGDDGNDIECFCRINRGIAMGNAVESIKNVAKSVTRSNNENGVYYALVDVLGMGKKNNEAVII